MNEINGVVDMIEDDGLLELNEHLGAWLKDAMGWQMSGAEYAERLDEATHAVAAIFNKPYMQDA